MATIENENKLAKNLFDMTWPMVFGVLSLMSYQLVDSAFIGQLGVNPLAAVGFTLPVYLVVIGLQVGIGVATTAIISQALGRGDENYARESGSLIIILGSALVFILGIAIWSSHEWLLMSLGGTQEVLPYFTDYWMYWVPGAWLGAFLYFGYSICRAHGNTMLPGITMVISSLLNIALDPIFIFVLDLGIQGAAIATIISFFIGCLIVYPKIVRMNWLSVSFINDRTVKTLKEVCRISAPAMVGQLLPSLSAIASTIIIAAYGTSVIAAWGLGGRMEFFSIVVVLALTMSIPPLVGKFVGAQRFDLVEKVVLIAAKFIFVWQLGVAALWLLTADLVMPLMTKDASVAEVVDQYISLIPLSYGPLGICMILVSACNAMSEPFKALLISILRLFVCFIPCLYVGGYVAGVPGLVAGAFVGNILAGFVAWATYRQAISKLKLAPASPQPA